MLNGTGGCLLAKSTQVSPPGGSAIVTHRWWWFALRSASASSASLLVDRGRCHSWCAYLFYSWCLVVAVIIIAVITKRKVITFH